MNPLDIHIEDILTSEAEHDKVGNQRLLTKETEALMERLLIKKLILPGRMGDIFKVLIQYKELEEKPDLSGLKKDIFI